MAKEIERAGFTITTMCNLLNVAKSMGNNPQLSKEEEWKLRYHRVGVALDALTKDVEGYTVFPVKI